MNNCDHEWIDLIEKTVRCDHRFNFHDTVDIYLRVCLVCGALKTTFWPIGEDRIFAGEPVDTSK